jgi:cytochrome c556
MLFRIAFWLMVCGTLALLSIDNLRAEPKAPSRARPPAWNDDVLDAFFDDALEQLRGPRPQPGNANLQPDAPGPPPGPAAARGSEGGGSSFGWSERISEEALAAEIKRSVNALAAPLSSPSRFKSGGALECRRQFSVLAVLYGITEQYDRPLRLQRDAPQLRQSLARAARNAKTAGDQSFAESQACKADLDDSLRGQRLAAADAPSPWVWSELADRSQLMIRMEQAQQEGIGSQLANERTFRREASRIREEAQLLSALGEVIQREAFDYWDDETYLEYAQQLVTASMELAAAAEQQDYAAARAAAGNLSQSCAACHEGYRG